MDYYISWFLFSSLLFLWVSECSSTDFCYTYSNGWKWCDHGCCDGYCCDGLASWAIGLIVIGVIVFLCIVIVVVCVAMKSKGHSGRVIQPQPQPQSTMMVIGGPQTGGYGPPAYNTVIPPSQPPAYGTAAYNPSASGVYPPPPQPAYADPFAAAAATGSK